MPQHRPARGRRPAASGATRALRCGRTSRSERGQASVELVALLPLLALVAALLWQAVVAGQVAWHAGAAATAAARAAALGGDADAATAAARRAVPPALRRGVRVVLDDGRADVRVAVPAVVGGARLHTVRVRAGFPGQA